MKLRCFFTLIILAFCSVASATQYRLLSLAQQIEEADVFTLGRVVSVTPALRGEKIWSKVILSNEQTLNYDLETIEVMIPGGSLGGRSMKIDTVEIPKVGEIRAYLLKKIGDAYVLNNLALGEYIQADKDSFNSKIFSDTPGLKNLSFNDFIKASRNKYWKIKKFTTNKLNVSEANASTLHPNDNHSSTEFFAAKKNEKLNDDRSNNYILMIFGTLFLFVVLMLLAHMKIKKKSGGLK